MNNVSAITLYQYLHMYLSFAYLIIFASLTWKPNSLQSFAIPGSIFLSILSGFLFSFPVALFLVCFVSLLIALTTNNLYATVYCLYV